MQMIQEPTQEFGRFFLLFETKSRLAGPTDFLKKLVRADLALEQPRIPHLFRKTCETLHQLAFLARKIGQEEVIPQRLDVE